jgi:hypothetical protein
MKRYNVKNLTGEIAYMDVLSEDENGYVVRITRIQNGSSIRETEKILSRHLFEMCLKIGYIQEIGSYPLGA